MPIEEDALRLGRSWPISIPVVGCILAINAIGIFAAIQGGVRRVMSQNILESLREEVTPSQEEALSNRWIGSGQLQAHDKA